MSNNNKFNWLSWEILKNKVLYYRPSIKYNKKHKPISDQEYDALEIEYLELCLNLGRKNTLVHKEYEKYKCCGPGMMEIDETRPCVKYMVYYLCKKD